MFTKHWLNALRSLTALSTVSVREQLKAADVALRVESSQGMG
ncbi:MAG: hypothetical protein V7K25_00130 [Nostoc sp.]